MQVHESARNHGIAPEDGIYAATHALYESMLEDDNPTRTLRLGFDTTGRLLEVVVLRFDSGNELLIHAMRARPQYYELLSEQ